MRTRRIRSDIPALSMLLPLFLLLSGCGGGSTAVDATNGYAPVIAVAAATTVTENSAILNGYVIPNGLPTDAWFEYGSEDTLSSFSSTSPKPIGTSLDNIAVTDSVSGLNDNTTYYFRICSSNTKGTIKSSITNLTTSYAGAPPVVVTSAATSVAATTATLNGNATPNGVATTAWFEWGTSPTLSSYDSTPSQAVGSGMSSVAVDTGLTGLSSGSTYYYRIAATNRQGTSRGSILSFVPGAAPAVTTLAATSVNATAATLNGNATPNGLATTAWFEWGTSSTLSSYDSTPSQAVGSGTSGVAVDAGLTGLATGTTYYYRIAANNGQGTNRGSILSFIPGTAPTASTSAATSVGATTATLNGSATPNGLATTAFFEWGTSSTLSSCFSTSSQAVGSGTSGVAVNAGLTGLSSGNTYYFRIVTNNAQGTSRGLILSFVPGASPAVSTSVATPVGSTTATLKGNVTPNGLETTSWFEYGTSQSFGSETPHVIVGSGTSSVAVTAGLTGLSSGTKYYFRLVASNSSGTRQGSTLNFTTVTPGAPIPTTLEPERIATGAICNGKVNPNGIASIAWIEWGTDPNLSVYNSSSSQSIGSGTSNRYLSEPLTYLTAGTTYYCRVAGQNSKGTTQGAIASFTVIDGTWTINDNFTTDETGEYAITGTGSISHNSGTGKAVVTAGSGKTLTITKNCYDGGISTGTFSMEFEPTAENGSGANLTIRLADTSDTYFDFSANDGWFRKYRRGLLVDNVQLPATYSVGNTYTIKITFAQMVATVEAFDARVSMDTNDDNNPVNSLVITATEMNATYDNIRVTKKQ